MSVHVISWVLEHSTAQLGNRLVLIVLADHAKKDGTAAWPSVDTIAHEARMSRRQVQRCLRELAAEGHIEATGKTRRGVTVYSVKMTGASLRHPEGRQSVTPGVSDMSPEPSLNRPYEPSPATPRERDVAFDTLAEVTKAMPRSHGTVGMVVAELRKLHPQLDDQELADEIRRRAANYVSEWPGRALTPTALGTHWLRMGEVSSSSATIRDLTRRARGAA